MYNTKEEFQKKLNENIHSDLEPYPYINKKDIEIIKQGHLPNAGFMGMHIIIKDNIVHIIEKRASHQNRNEIVLGMLQTLVKCYKLPNTEFFIDTEDILRSESIGLPIFAHNKRIDSIGILCPDFSFYRFDWPHRPSDRMDIENWGLFRDNVIPNSDKFPVREKSKKIFFRGALTCPGRNKICHGQASTKPDLFDINTGPPGGKPSEYISIHKHYKYLFLLDLLGANDSVSARFKYLTVMNSIIFSIREDINHNIGFWNHILIDKYNYFKFSGSDYFEKMIETASNLKNSQTEVDRIINNLAKTKNFFTMDTVYNYFYTLIIEYTKKLNYKVRLP